MGISNDIAKLNAMQGLPHDNKTKTQAAKGDVKPNSVFGNGFTGSFTGKVDYNVPVSGKVDYSGPDVSISGKVDYSDPNGSFTGKVDYNVPVSGNYIENGKVVGEYTEVLTGQIEYSGSTGSADYTGGADYKAPPQKADQE